MCLLSYNKKPLRLIRTTPDKDFHELTRRLNEYLLKNGGLTHYFYHLANNDNSLRNVIIAYYNGRPIGCGAWCPHDEATIELKKIYVIPAYRRTGVASKIILELQEWGTAMGFSHCFVETGIFQSEMINLLIQEEFDFIPDYKQTDRLFSTLSFKKNLDVHEGEFDEQKFC